MPYVTQFDISLERYRRCGVRCVSLGFGTAAKHSGGIRIDVGAWLGVFVRY